MKKETVCTMNSEQLQDDINQFLSRGGVVEQVPTIVHGKDEPVSPKQWNNGIGENLYSCPDIYRN